MTGRRLLAALAGLALAVAVALNAVAGGFFIDDAYISFHYADNLARDGSLYYNRGEHGPVGYTNPLYVFLLAALRLASFGAVPYEVIARALGSLALAAILTALLWTIVSRPERPGRGAALARGGLALLLVLLFPHVLPNFYGGLETGLFTLCLFAMILSAAPRTRRGEICFLAALAGALCLRMDGAFLAAPLAGLYVLDALRRSDPRRVLRLGYAALAAGLVYLVQGLLSGFQLPLSFHQKSSAFSARMLWSYESFFLLATIPLLVAVWRRTERPLAALALLYPLFVSLFYSFFMPWMYKRYVFPAAFALFAALLLSYFELDLRQKRRELALLCAYAVLVFPLFLPESFSWISGYRVAMLNARGIADAMSAAGLPAGHRVLATPDAGFLPYRTDWRLLDLLGLTTPEVLTGDPTEAVRRRTPTLLILTAPNGSRPGDLTLPPRPGYPAAAVPPGYRFVKHLPFTNRYWWSELDYGYFLFVNRNASPALLRGLQNVAVDVEKEIGWQGRAFRLLRGLVSWAPAGGVSG